MTDHPDLPDWAEFPVYVAHRLQALEGLVGLLLNELTQYRHEPQRHEFRLAVPPVTQLVVEREASEVPVAAPPTIVVETPPLDLAPLVDALTPRTIVKDVRRTQDGEITRIVERPLAVGQDAPLWGEGS